ASSVGLRHERGPCQQRHGSPRRRLPQGRRKQISRNQDTALLRRAESLPLAPRPWRSLVSAEAPTGGVGASASGRRDLAKRPPRDYSYSSRQRIQQIVKES